MQSKGIKSNTHTHTIMANRRANPFSISSLLDKKDEKKAEEKCVDIKKEPCQENSEDECSKDEKERIPSITEDTKQHRIHSWFTEYQARQTSIEASKYIQYYLFNFAHPNEFSRVPIYPRVYKQLIYADVYKSLHFRRILYSTIARIAKICKSRHEHF